MRALLTICVNHRVHPVIISLHHCEQHFYGIRYGETFHEWNTLSGREMRLRVDEVHAEVGMPHLGRVHYHAESLDGSLFNLKRLPCWRRWAVVYMLATLKTAQRHQIVMSLEYTVFSLDFFILTFVSL